MMRDLNNKEDFEAAVLAAVHKQHETSWYIPHKSQYAPFVAELAEIIFPDPMETPSETTPVAPQTSYVAANPVPSILPLVAAVAVLGSDGSYQDYSPAAVGSDSFE